MKSASMPRRCVWLLFIAIACMPLAAWAGSVRATLDRNQITLGETVTLSLTADDQVMADAPDVSMLSHDFAILGSSTNRRLEYINGDRHVQVVVGIALRPLHAGTLQIPPLPFAGTTTQALPLEVRPADAANVAAGQAKVFLEAVADPQQAYVGQQLTLVVKLFFDGNLSGGSLDDPLADGVEVRRLGDDLNYQVDRAGRHYNVIERRYALIPQHAGHVVIPGLSFQGEMLDMNDPSAFFSRAGQVSAASPVIPLDVRAAPASASSSAWLPARQLDLSMEAVPPQGGLRVGQPVSLAMSVQAVGLPSEALPALTLPTLQGATVYPDKPVDANHVDGNWIVGQRRQNFSVVPSQSGTLVIPEITLHWWNTTTDQAEVARIPAQTFTVLPSPEVASPPPANPLPMAPSAPQSVTGTPWRWIALASLSLWLASVVVWLGWRHWPRRRRSIVATAPPAGSGAKAAFLQVANGGDAPAQATSLLAWARVERPTLRNLGELSQALASTEQRDVIAALQRRCYAGANEPDVGARLIAAFRSGFAWQHKDKDKKSGSPLPPLYPF